ITVAEIVLGAEGAMIRAAARHFHLGAGAVERGIETMVMVRMLLYRVTRPAQGRQAGHVDGLRAALHANVVAVAPRQPGDLAPAFARRLRQPDQHFLALALYGGINVELLQRDPRRRRGMRADRD